MENEYFLLDSSYLHYIAKSIGTPPSNEQGLTT